MSVRSKQLLRILVADQHPIIRAGIKMLLTKMSSRQQFEVEEAETTEEAIAMVTADQYSVVLMEYNLPGRGGIKATEIILSQCPHTAVIAIMYTDERAHAERIIRAGAKGCILLNVGPDNLLVAIRTVMAGGRFYSNEIAQQLLGHRVVANRDPLERLTTRKRQVFLFILRGMADREIALELCIAKRTVDKHRQHINYKLGTRTPLELLQAGLRLGLVKAQ